MTLLFIGTTELLLILIGGLALLLFGGKKLPEMMRGLGKGVREFKDGMKEQPTENNAEENKEEQNQEQADKPNESKQ